MSQHAYFNILEVMRKRQKKGLAFVIADANPWCPFEYRDMVNTLCFRVLMVNDMVLSSKYDSVETLWLRDKAFREGFKATVSLAFILDKLSVPKAVWSWCLVDLDEYAVRFWPRKEKFINRIKMAALAGGWEPRYIARLTIPSLERYM